ncbi:MAG: carboxypeptidase-like regulatory domain-containing protein, partial [Bacteroidales bacterium]|nr:carboxypeptidase-like regulatory domain-containing protein [Bacteroidales bacterium]
MRVFIYMALFFFSVSPAFNQSLPILSGSVKNASSGEPLPDVSVICVETGQGTTSDQAGNFAFDPGKEGPLQIKFSSIGYSAKTVEINFNKKEDTYHLHVLLEKAIIGLDEVTIEENREKRKIISPFPYAGNIEYREKLIEHAITDVGTFLRSSQNISGIRKGGTQIDPVLRGFKFSQLNVIINSGQKIEGGCPNRMDPATAHIEPEEISSIEVLKGPYALRYGPAFGGVINLRTIHSYPTDSNFIHIHALKSYESNWQGDKDYLSVAAGYRLGFIRISGGRKNYGNYKDGNGNEIRSSFVKNYYSLQAGIRPSKNQIFTIDYGESKGRDVLFPSLPMDERKDDTRLMSADYRWENTSGFVHFVGAKMYRSDVNHEMDNKERPFSDTVVAISKIKAINTGFRIETGMKILQGELRAGVDYEFIRKNGHRDKNMILQVP